MKTHWDTKKAYETTMPKVAETTGLNEDAIIYLSKISQSSLSVNIDIINLLLNEEPYFLHYGDSIIAEGIQEHQYIDSFSDSTNAKPILEVLREEWNRNDYLSSASDEEIFAQEMKDSEEIKVYYSSNNSANNKENEQESFDTDS